MSFIPGAVVRTSRRVSARMEVRRVSGLKKARWASGPDIGRCLSTGTLGMRCLSADTSGVRCQGDEGYRFDLHTCGRNKVVDND